MTIHREGYKTIALVILTTAFINILMLWFFASVSMALCLFILLVTLSIVFLTVYFFRIPVRKLTLDEGCIIAPADGKVVVIEEMIDEEYFKAKRLQVSIFMSPLNVHVNRNPVSGEIVYSQYHPGKFLVAWHPKSSTENERHSVVIRRGTMDILVKQIAGALAKRIVNYLEPGMRVVQGEELGFIKFGSRVDILLPPGTSVDVSLNEHVKGGVTVIARI
jgi:phosphatidylserine decarboxylase